MENYPNTFNGISHYFFLGVCHSRSSNVTHSLILKLCSPFQNINAMKDYQSLFLCFLGFDRSSAFLGQCDEFHRKSLILSFYLDTLVDCLTGSFHGKVREKLGFTLLDSIYYSLQVQFPDKNNEYSKPPPPPG